MDELPERQQEAPEPQLEEDEDWAADFHDQDDDPGRFDVVASAGALW